MTTSMNKELIYGEYINPTLDHSSAKKENPLVLMAQACNNIGKDFSSSISTSNKRHFVSSPTNSNSSKQRKLISPTEGKKSLKRCSSSPIVVPTKKISLHPPPSPSTTRTKTSNPLPSYYYPPPSPFLFDSFLLHQLNKTIYSSSIGHSLNSAFSPSPSSQRSTYLMDSILSPLKVFPSSPSFVCNWKESTHPDGSCGQRFPNQFSLLEHLCTSHTSTLFKSPFSSFYSPTSLTKL